MLVVKADSQGERWRSLAAAVIGAGCVLLIDRVLPADPIALPVEPNWLYGFSCGLAAYLMGRSRRAETPPGISRRFTRNE
jgi:hypothetical protein